MPLILINMPLGNKDDLSPRAARALAEGTYFFVEDTRTFKEFLALCQISLAGKFIESWHDHSPAAQLQKIRDLLAAGEKVYLASEAGSAVISDPGFAAIKNLDLDVVQLDTLPGPSAPIAALELSGLPPYPFTFWGFLPRTKQELCTWCHNLTPGQTHVAFEAPTRLLASMDLIVTCLPQVAWAIGRELTKKFQSVYRGHAADWAAQKKSIVLKGEIVIVLYLPPGSQEKMISPTAQQAWDRPTPKNLAKLLAESVGTDTATAYQRLTQHTQKSCDN